MAHDYLAIQDSSTPLEWVFSSSELTGAKHHNRLTVDAFKSLQLLKSTYHNGHVSAAVDASQHIDALIDLLDNSADFENGDLKDMPSLIAM